MNTRMLAIPAALFLATAPALAAQPPAATSTTQAVHSPVPPATAPSSAPVARDAAAIAQSAASVGYKPRQRDGKTVYCRTDLEIGSKFNSTQCISEEQVAAVVHRSLGNQDSIGDLQKKSLMVPPAIEPYTGMAGKQ